MSKRIFINLLLLALLGAGVIVYMQELSFGAVPLREAIFLSTSLIGTLAGLYALHKYGFNGPRTRTIVFLTAGMGYFFLGDLLFSYYSYFLHIDPFPSFADVFYLLAYPFLLIGLINEVRIGAPQFAKLHKAIVSLLVLMSVIMGALVIYFGIYLAYSPEESLFSNLIALSYGVGDLIFIVVAMLLLALAWEFRGGALSRVWLLLCFSMTANLLADVLFALYTQQYTSSVWFYKAVPDMLWMTSYLLFASALFDLGISIDDAYEKIKVLQKGKKTNT